LKIKKIIIGVTQFGMRYGIMNKSNCNKKNELRKVLYFSKKKKIKFLYTSKYYGNSNKFLANENLNFFEIFIKFKAEDLLDEKFILDFNKDKNKLKKDKLILIIDGFEKLSNKKASEIYDIITDLKKTKIINKFGYSIYSFNKLKNICNNFKPDILQCPYNVIDRRLEENKFLQFLKQNKIEVHVRSIFLQGLLVIPPSKLPRKFLKWKEKFQIFSDHMSKNKLSSLNGCINFVQNNKNIDKILIGIDNISHLKEIVNVKSQKIKLPNINIRNQKLINPSKW
jgi:predicted aldo/keto reductase-like oxidoreductase